ncbi:MAG TPA: hypothetical protein VEZ90_18395 [Blastocatellia bacterium]|nr:hypothetical protein [Blastocatellia bacterium]
MNRRNWTARTVHLILLGVALCVALSLSASAQESKVGTVDFPTSTKSADAQGHFIRGVAELHSFWFEEAADEFRHAEAADPEFMMAYWGEAMTYNHPLWAQQDADSARKVLAKIHDTPQLTARERAFLNAVKVLYGAGDKLSRDIAYSKAMEKIYRAYPNDDEAACFCALSLLGTVRSGDKGYGRQMKAAAIALAVFEKNPDHPGAAHYIIHAFDDPDHAILALPAARRYAEIAPAANHAQHMPSHIFLQLGMWKEAAASNERAWATSDEWVKRKNLSITQRDYHSFQWLEYVYLQQGRYEKAADLIDTMRKVVNDTKGQPMMSSVLNRMQAAYIVETQKWELADDWFTAKPGRSPASAENDAHAHHGDHGNQGAGSSSYGGGGDSLSVYVRGLSAAKRGLPVAQRCAEQLSQIAANMTGDEYRAKGVRIMALEVRAAAAASGHDYEQAIDLMKQAVAVESEMSEPSGPPEIVKPPLELYGEILLQANRPATAAEQFEASLLREPNRARSLIGKARALAASGESGDATATYGSFEKMWDQADSARQELTEAKSRLSERASSVR